MASFVIGSNLLLLQVKHMALALGAKHDLLHTAYQIILRDDLALFTGGKYGRLVHKVREIRARETRRTLGYNVQVNIVEERLLKRMNLHNLLAIFEIGQIKYHSPIKPPRSQ